MLEVSGLNAGYGRIPVLDCMEFNLEEGEVVGVLGHNGMGKTTLLRTLMGEIQATSGLIRFAGEDVTRLGMYQRARRGIGYVPQGREIYPELTVRENLRMGEIRYRGKSVVPELLGYFPILENLLDREGRTLSGGEQQILALARCLAGRPRLVLLDEPTEGIAPSVIDQIESKLAELAKSFNLTILLVEQNLGFIAALANRVLIIKKGRIEATVETPDLSNQNIIDEYLGI